MVRLIDLTGLSAFIAIHCIQQSTNGGQLSGVKRVTTPSSTYQICSMQSRTGANGLFDQRGLSLGRPAFAIPFLLSISPLSPEQAYSPHRHLVSLPVGPRR